MPDEFEAKIMIQRNSPTEGLTPGRIVHYVPHNDETLHPGECRAAIVSGVHESDGKVNLTVFFDGTNDSPHYSPANNTFWRSSVPHAERTNPSPHTPGTWHWPERA